MRWGGLSNTNFFFNTMNFRGGRNTESRTLYEIFQLSL